MCLYMHMYVLFQAYSDSGDDWPSNSTRRVFFSSDFKLSLYLSEKVSGELESSQSIYLLEKTVFCLEKTIWVTCATCRLRNSSWECFFPLLLKVNLTQSVTRRHVSSAAISQPRNQNLLSYMECAGFRWSESKQRLVLRSAVTFNSRTVSSPQDF